MPEFGIPAEGIHFESSSNGSSNSRTSATVVPWLLTSNLDAESNHSGFQNPNPRIPRSTLELPELLEVLQTPQNMKSIHTIQMEKAVTSTRAIFFVVYV